MAASGSSKAIGRQRSRPSLLWVEVDEIFVLLSRPRGLLALSMASACAVRARARRAAERIGPAEAGMLPHQQEQLPVKE